MVDKPFLMAVEDTMTITGRGTVATGRVERGTLHVNDPLEIIGIKRDRRTRSAPVSRCSASCSTRPRPATTSAACSAASSARRSSAARFSASPVASTPHTEFEGQVYILTKEEGGRHTPFFDGYRPQFYFRTTDVTGVAHLPEGTEMVMPGDNVEIKGELIHPDRHGRGLALRYPRGWPHRWLRPRDEDHQVTPLHQ